MTDTTYTLILPDGTELTGTSLARIASRWAREEHADADMVGMTPPRWAPIVRFYAIQLAELHRVGVHRTDHAPYWCNQNGMIACPAHGGDYLAQALNRDETPRTIATPLDTWEPLSRAESIAIGLACEQRSKP